MKALQSGATQHPQALILCSFLIKKKGDEKENKLKAL